MLLTSIFGHRWLVYVPHFLFFWSCIVVALLAFAGEQGRVTLSVGAGAAWAFWVVVGGFFILPVCYVLAIFAMFLTEEKRPGENILIIAFYFPMFIFTGLAIIDVAFSLGGA